MAKKKKVNKKKKTSKRGTPKPRTVKPTSLSEQEKQILLHTKIHQVMVENPELLCGLAGEDTFGRKFGICEAALVFRTYNAALGKHNLTIILTDTKTVLGHNCVLVDCKFKLTDITTGYSEILAGSGLGMNGQWSVNTAQTLAFKEALLLSFVCSWPQPEEYRDEVQREARQTFGPAQSPEEIQKAIGDYFEKYNVKGAKSGNKRDSKKS